jgi:hypothetical protein
MDQSLLDQLREQYHDFFTVEQAVLANVKPLSCPLPTEADFLTMIPEPFRMASEQASLDRSALRALSQLGDMAEDLAVYLRAQAKKLDMLMRYLLIQQDDPMFRRNTHSFGGSAFNFYSEQPYPSGQTLEVKLFLNGTDGAVYFLITVLDSVPQNAVQNEITPDNQSISYFIQCAVSRIRDEDREVLVRASLHEQSRQLKAKARLRQSTGMQ